MATATETTTTGPSKSYKYTWARFVAKSTLEDDLAALKDRIHNAFERSPALGQVQRDIAAPEASVEDVLESFKEVCGTGVVPPKDGKLKLGIVGAGVAGLFTAMLIDWLNKEVKGLDIDYDIIEAADEDRLGGRLYTHEFSKKEHDYYDVGAMRFPQNHVMERTFQLFKKIGLKFEKGGLIPYYLGDREGSAGVCPSYFNDVHQVGDIWQQGADDPYDLNNGLPPNGKIPKELLKKDPGKIVGEALAKFTDLAKTKLDEHANRAESQPKESEGKAAESKLWKMLMEADNMSVRQYLSTPRKKKDPKQGSSEKDTSAMAELPDFDGYNYNTIEWLETATYGTGWYDQALTECVLEELDFTVEKDGKFWCIEGGTQRVARMMRAQIQKSVQLNSRALKINANVPDRAPGEYTPMTVKIERKNPYTKKVDIREEEYFAVFNSTTLGALQRMDLKDAGLLWGTKQAIRSLGYGASCKVGIKFATPWWQLEPFRINLGGVSRTDLPLRVCVYPSYNIHDHADESAVLLCSYTWGQDAQRIATLISSDSPDGEDQLKSLMLRNLARLHANEAMPYEKLLPFLEEQYLTHHAYDWYHDENMGGAFAFFGPGQFSNMWQEIIKPNAFGQLYLIGEAASSHHAWIVGALESVVRAVYLMLEGLNAYDPHNESYKLAMDRLTEGAEDDLPFHPLPEEMPQRQLNTTKEEGADLADNIGEGKPLTYAAAVAALSVVESFIELKVPAEEKMRA